MNNELQVFENQEFGEIRTMCIDGEPWFVGKDVADALGYGKGKSLNNAVSDHVEDDDKGVTKMDTPGGMQNIIIINESGLYSLILGSRLPSAKKFKRWITSEVLPTIRKTGTYGKQFDSDEPITVSITNNDSVIECAKIMAVCLDGNRRYVLNILRHIIPDIDDEHLIPVKVAETTVEVPVTTNTAIVIRKNLKVGYNKPFNWKKFDKYLRDNKIISSELEYKTGMSSGCVSKWKNGIVSPSEYSRQKISEVLGLRIGYFDK